MHHFNYNLNFYNIKIQNIEFEEVKDTYTDAILNMVENNSIYGCYKYLINKKTKINIPNRGDIDILFGLYSENDCEFKIEIGGVGLFQEGNILKKQIRYINSIPVVSLKKETDIFVETTEDCYLIFSVLNVEFRKILLDYSLLTGEFIFNEGNIYRYTNQTFYDYKIPFLPIGKEKEKIRLSQFSNYSIKDKIKNMKQSQEFKEKNGLLLTEYEKEYILRKFDLLDYYMTEKMK